MPPHDAALPLHLARPALSSGSQSSSSTEPAALTSRKKERPVIVTPSLERSSSKLPSDDWYQQLPFSDKRAPVRVSWGFPTPTSVQT